MNTNCNKGLLIAICGIDGSGKSTQEQLLAAWLRTQNISVVTTKQPTDFYRTAAPVQKYLSSGHNEMGMAGLALLAAADRQYHIRNVIQPALEQGMLVITNRYIYSSYAFFVARGLDFDFINYINPNIIKPGLTILLDLPAKEAIKRVLQRDKGVIKYEEAKVEFMESVRKNFLKFQDESFFVVDGTLSEEIIQAQIQKRYIQLFNPR